MPAQRRGQWRQSPGFWHRLESGALLTCSPGKKRAQMLRKVVDRKCSDIPLIFRFTWWMRGLGAHRIQDMKTPLHFQAPLDAGAGLGSPEEVRDGKGTEPAVGPLGLLRASLLLA